MTNLLGGPVRDEVPLTALITRADAPDAVGIAEHAAKVVAEGGFTAVKLKGTKDSRGDVEILREIRRALPEVDLRLPAAVADPQGLLDLAESHDLRSPVNRVLTALAITVD